MGHDRFDWIILALMVLPALIMILLSEINGHVFLKESCPTGTLPRYSSGVFGSESFHCETHDAKDIRNAKDLKRICNEIYDSNDRASCLIKVVKNNLKKSKCECEEK